eukprot:GSA25T00000124001.1
MSSVDRHSVMIEGEVHRLRQRRLQSDVDFQIARLRQHLAVASSPAPLVRCEYVGYELDFDKVSMLVCGGLDLIAFLLATVLLFRRWRVQRRCMENHHDENNENEKPSSYEKSARRSLSLAANVKAKNLNFRDSSFSGRTREASKAKCDNAVWHQTVQESEFLSKDSSILTSDPSSSSEQSGQSDTVSSGSDSGRSTSTVEKRNENALRKDTTIRRITPTRHYLPTPKQGKKRSSYDIFPIEHLASVLFLLAVPWGFVVAQLLLNPNVILDSETDGAVYLWLLPLGTLLHLCTLYLGGVRADDSGRTETR